MTQTSKSGMAGSLTRAPGFRRRAGLLYSDRVRRLLCYAAAVEAGSLLELDADFLCIGVGMASAAMAITQRLCEQDYDEVLLFGVGGAWPDRLANGGTQQLAIGSCVLLGSDRFGDLGVTMPEGFESLSAMGIGEDGPWPMDPELTRAAAARLGCGTVDAVTVATGSASDPAALELASRTSFGVESMEGAAVALVCQRFGVPLVQLRCVSNYVGDRAQSQWSLDQACGALQDAVRALLA